MPSETDELTEFRCPGCGGPVGGFDPEDTCMGIRCLACDWAVVTTNSRHPHFQMASDETLYGVWVEWGGDERLRVIAAVGNALFIEVKAARELIDRRLPIASGVQALEVQRLYSKIKGIGLSIRVHPEFRWRLD
jgi:hypothetical protein